jgi:uncharacterized protein GlcG (DUF336 family)
MRYVSANVHTREVSMDRTFASVAAIILLTVTADAQIPTLTSTPPTLSDRLDESIKRADLPFALAKDAAEAALKACTDRNGSISVAVTNGHGELRVYFAHEDMRSHDDFEHTRRKAFTALQTAKPSRDYPSASFNNGNMKLAQSYFDAPPLSQADYSGRAGALPILRDGELLGVISVDGRWDYPNDGENYDADERCAQAGVNAIEERVRALKPRRRWEY